MNFNPKRGSLTWLKALNSQRATPLKQNCSLVWHLTGFICQYCYFPRYYLIYKKNAFKSHSKSNNVSTSIKSSNCLHLSNAKALPETILWQSRNLMMAVGRWDVRFIEVLEVIPLVSPPMAPFWLPLIQYFDRSNAVKLQCMAQMTHKSSQLWFYWKLSCVGNLNWF